MSEPASEKQINFLRVLADKLRALTEDQGEIADKIDEASASVLSKKDASDLIEALIASIRALGGEVKTSAMPKPVRKTEAIAETPQQIAHRRERELHHARVAAWNDMQIKLHGGPGRKPPPAGNAPMKIWHERPDFNNGRYYNPIESGWAWQCSHPDHRSVNGRYGVIRGGSKLGRDVTIQNAMDHWNKYHTQEKES